MYLKKILIMDDSLSGHHLEYIHHLYLAAGEKKDYLFIFCLPESFSEKSLLLTWPLYDNIKIIFFQDKFTLYRNFIHRSFVLSNKIRKIIGEYDVSDVFLVSLIGYLPFLPFLIDKKIKISGIIYNIYLYRWKTSSFFKKVEDVIKYFLISKFNLFNNIFILNDGVSCRFLNKTYNTSKFKYLPDPYTCFQGSIFLDLKARLGIKEDKRIILHFGALSISKGTLAILDAIRIMQPTEREKYIFIFAGVLSHDLELIFKQKVDKLKNNCEIIFLEGFQSYEMLASLCSISHAILIPYMRTGQSSGCIGYAAQFKKPVIAPKKGLIGKLVKKYHLGVLIEDISEKSIIAGIESISIWKYVENDYLEKNSILNFQKHILDSL